MKTKQKKETNTIDSIETFRASFFPKYHERETVIHQKTDIDYGSMIALDILDGIKHDLQKAGK